METAIKKRRYTYNDYLKTPDDIRYELINGNLIMSPSPISKHQIIVMELSGRIWQFARQKKIGRVLSAPCDVYFDKLHLTQPDILFISKERLSIITEKNVQGAPDLIVEVVSSASIHRDMVEKKSIYEKFGVKEYWLAFPDEELVEIYELKNKAYQLYKTFSKEESLISSMFPGMKILLSEVF